MTIFQDGLYVLPPPSSPMCRSIWKKVPNSPIKKTKPRRRSFFSTKIRCQECHSQIMDTIFRCASCHTSTSYDLCSRCFENNICHPQHRSCVFVKADMKKSNVAVEWIAQNRPSTNEQYLHREFDSSDYDLLLSLSGNTTPTLHNHLIQALHEASVEERQNKTCCICSASFTSSDSVRQLNCRFNQNHMAHESCIVELMIEAQTSNTYGNVGAQCPTCQNKSWFFPMLADDPTAKSNVDKMNSNRNRTKEEKSSKKVDLEACNNTLGNLCILGRSSQMNVEIPRVKNDAIIRRRRIARNKKYSK